MTCGIIPIMLTKEKIISKYPVLFEQINNPETPIGDRGIECRDGWLVLIDELSEKLQKINVDLAEPIKYAQIKEKFGGLRIYVSNFDPLAAEHLDEAEKKSFTMCEVCGKVGELRTNKHWHQTLCVEHFKA